MLDNDLGVTCHPPRRVCPPGLRGESAQTQADGRRTSSHATSTPKIGIGGKGGYAADNVNIAIHAEGGDSFRLLTSPERDRYPGFQTSNGPSMPSTDVW